jgi:hypothetical protein
MFSQLEKRNRSSRDMEGENGLIERISQLFTELQGLKGNIGRLLCRQTYYKMLTIKDTLVRVYY